MDSVVFVVLPGHVPLKQARRMVRTAFPVRRRPRRPVARLKQTDIHAERLRHELLGKDLLLLFCAPEPDERASRRLR